MIARAGRMASNAHLAGPRTEPGDDAPSLSVHHVPPADLADRRDDLRLDQMPLRLWFRAMYHLTQSKQGISSLNWAAASE